MPISALYLKNWKTHKDSSFEFAKGTNLLIGKMGSGKTSVMDAISFALFGTFPSLTSRQVNISNLITAKPVKEKEAKIELSFSYNNSSYKVVRTIKGSKTEALLYKENKLIAGPQTTEVNKKIEEILSMSFDLFAKAVYSEQNQIDFFLKLPPNKRKQLFDDLLDIEKYETARRNAKTLINKFKRLKKEKEETAQSLKTSLQESKSKILDKIKDEKAKLPALTEKISSLQTKLSIIKQQYENLKNKKQKYDSLVSKKNRLSAYIEANSKISFSKEKLQNLKNEFIKLKSQKEEALKNKTSFDSLLNQKTKKKYELEHQISNLKKEKTALLPKQLEGKTVCPLCSQPISQHTIESLKKEALEHNKKIEKQIEEKTKEILKIQTEIKTLESQYKETAKTFSSIEEKISELKLKISSLEDAERKISLLQDYKKELSEIEQKISLLGFKDSFFLETQEKYSKLREKFVSAKKDEQLIQETIKNHLSYLNDLEKQEQQYKKLEKEAELLSNILSNLEVFSSALASTQIELREHLLSSLNQSLNLLWTYLYPYSDYSSLCLFPEKAGATDTYTLKVKASNGWIDVSSWLSGGEKTVASIVLRIAFSLVLTKNLSWLILDEPTHNLDTQAIEKMSDLFSNQLPSLVEQIFIITHDKNLEKAATSCLYLLDRDKGKDEPTRIEKLL